VSIAADSQRVRMLCAELGALIKEYEKDQAEQRKAAYPHARSNSDPTNPKLTGAIRRKSMDLTRALAEMRRW
jgi:hypothetical protein